MPVVAFEVLSTIAPHASRKPAAHADRDDSTPFSEMLDKSDKKPTAKDSSAAPHMASAKDANEPAQDSAKDSTKDLTKDLTKTAVKDGANGQDGKTGAKATTDAAAVTAADPADDTTYAPPANQDTANDFLAAVANVTGIPVAPVEAPKTEAKPADDAKLGDQDKDDAKADTAPLAAADATPTPVAAVVTAPVEAATTGVTPADTAPATAATAAIAAQGIAETVAGTDATGTKADATKDITASDIKAEAKTDAKSDKPQVAAKLDAPLLAPTDHAKQGADPQAAQPQQAQAQGPAQGQKPAADTAQPAKPAHQDGVSDVAAVTKPADTTQPLTLLQTNGLPPAQAADPAAPAPAATPQAVALPVAGIAIEIAGRALDGKKSFDIRLDPPELGKIHVRLDVDHKGEVTSIITADSSDTFDLLRRDAQSLERALQDAGVKTSSNGLQFSLRDQGGGQQNTPSQFTNSAHVVVRDDTLDSEINAPIYRSLSGTRAGVDIRV